ncbi:MAG: hypothetical protein JJE30_14715 [Desulfuromonadales bacterium]|nr:hypothetical protein [Desulfuromonadales bacterium]
MIAWVSVPKFLSSDLPTGRPFTRVEAAFSVALDLNNGKAGTLRGYAKIWQWTHPRVSRFLKEIEVLDQVTKSNPTNVPLAFHQRSTDVPLEPFNNNELQQPAFHLRSTDVPPAFRTIKNKNKKESSCVSPPSKRPPSGDHQTFIFWWAYAYERTQGKPYLTSGKDFKPVKELLTAYGLKPLVITACWFLTCQDEWLASKRDITMFKSQINRLPGAKDEKHNAGAYRAAGIIPPEGTLFENWHFWQQDEAQEKLAL